MAGGKCYEFINVRRTYASERYFVVEELGKILSFLFFVREINRDVFYGNADKAQNWRLTKTERRRKKKEDVEVQRVLGFSWEVEIKEV